MASHSCSMIREVILKLFIHHQVLLTFLYLAFSLCYFTFSTQPSVLPTTPHPKLSNMKCIGLRSLNVNFINNFRIFHWHRVDDLPFGLESNETWFPLFLYMLLGWLSFSWYTVHIWASHLLCGYLFIRWSL